MSHSIDFNRELGVIVLRYRGTVDFREIKHAFDELVLVQGFRSGLCLVADFRQCHTVLTGSDVSELAYHARNTDAKWGSTKWAFLAEKDLTFGLSRMYAALASDCQVTTHTFRSARDADNWLGIGIEMEEILSTTPELAATI